MTIQIPVPGLTVTPPPVTIDISPGGPWDAQIRAAGWTPTPTVPAYVAKIIYDMWGDPVRKPYYNADGTLRWGPPLGAHELTLPIPSGWDWHDGATCAGATPPVVNGVQWKCVTPWGQAIPVGGTLTGVTIQVACLETWALVAGSWIKLQSAAGVGGALYTIAGYQTTGHWPGVTAAAGILGQFPFTPAVINHWWPSDWPRIAWPAGMTALFTRQRLRRQGGDATTKIAVACGIDWYPDAQATGATGQRGVMQPRSRLLGDQWDDYTGSTLDAAGIAANPPPPAT